MRRVDDLIEQDREGGTGVMNGIYLSRSRNLEDVCTLPWDRKHRRHGIALLYRLCYQCELCDGYHHGSAFQSVMSRLIELP